MVFPTATVVAAAVAAAVAADAATAGLDPIWHLLQSGAAATDALRTYAERRIRVGASAESMVERGERLGLFEKEGRNECSF